MPSRYVREGILESPQVGAIGEAAEVMFYRLLLVADDYGLGDGRLTVIERKCWPAGGPDAEEIERRLTALEAAKHPRTGLGLIVRYEVDGHPYWWIPKFNQRTRSKPKFPLPPQLDPQGDPQENDGKPAADGQLTDKRPTTDGHVSGRWQSTDGHLQARSRSRSRSYSADDGQLPGNRRTTRTTAGERAAQQVIAEGRRAEANATEPPGGSVAALAARAGIRIPGNPNHPPENWQATTEQIDQQGEALGMQRLQFESDDDYATRIQQRINLG